MRQNSSGSQDSAKLTCQLFLKDADNLNPYPFHGLGLTMSALSTVAEVPAVAIAEAARLQDTCLSVLWIDLLSFDPGSLAGSSLLMWAWNNRIDAVGS